MGALTRDHAAERPEDVLRSAGWHGRGRQRAGGGGEVMRAPRLVCGRVRPGAVRLQDLLVVAAVVLAAASAAAQSRSAVPRTADKKPDLTGVWQAGNTQRGSWEETNGGVGLGGSGRNPAGPTVQSSTERPAGAQAA